MADLFADFPGPVLFGFPSGHTAGPAMTLPFGVRAASSASPRRGSIIEEAAVAVSATRASHRRVRHGDGDAGGDAEAQGHDVSGSDEDVYPPMSDFLAAEGIPRCSGYRAEHITARPRPGRRRQCDFARQRGARGGARSQDPLLLAARSDSRALSLGRAVDCHRRHARQDHDHVADRVAADARRRRSERARRRHRAATSASTARATGSGRGATSSSKATSTTARSSTRRRSS